MHKLNILIAFSLLTVTACTSQPAKDTQPVSAPPAIATPATSEQAPPLTELKNGKTLNMVRVMDGAACKNDLQGVKGTFLVYANPDDIERIKREKGAQIFADFEIKIQNLASEALQTATDATNLAEDPFAISAQVVQQKIANQLTANFQDSIAAGLQRFQQDTTLSIDIVPFTPSLIFYQKACEATQLEPDESQAPQ
ncbi:MAG: hypothetical protein Q8N35_00320 [Methylococcaceae bacterium]|jgi:hypothetical protein|nr:hypothetical protein [Methylococcaceae bacterium]MDZ4219169.1 hypothetical protein [Methylobacter sp.]MDP2394698.1 hypothetical protein [Methylococcaceae bacterium]MDP3018007.1 hypothetical protein [Methylococcaceae bacterium]MDP3389684.1 hypothetical protein [Methylococcaceae bacterium]